jgi:hypothetical protein
MTTNKLPYVNSFVEISKKLYPLSDDTSFRQQLAEGGIHNPETTITSFYIRAEKIDIPMLNKHIGYIPIITNNKVYTASKIKKLKTGLHKVEKELE